MSDAAKPFDPIDALAAIIKAEANITAAAATAARVDAAETILKTVDPGGIDHLAAYKVAKEYLIAVASGQNPNADTGARVRALKACIAGGIA